jgi:hypothetical protein
MNIEIPPGYGLRLLPDKSWEGAELDELRDKLLIWEAPRRGFTYTLSCDVSDGIGLDNSVIDVTRMPTVHEPMEQVAQFVTNIVGPLELAYLLDPIGRFYKDDEGQEALCAIETNASGISTQNELQAHLGYTNFYIWQTFDHRNPAKRYTQRLGWYTSPRSRPIMLDHYFKAINSADPLTGKPDYIINSPFTIAEMRNFITHSTLRYAEAAPGANDDCIMTGAIGVIVSHFRNYDEIEPVAEQRRRHSEELVRKQLLAERLGQRRDYINTDCTADEMDGREEEDSYYE